MVGLVPLEKDVIPMVLLVNMRLIKATYYKLFSHAAWLKRGTGLFLWSIGTNDAIGTNRK